MTAPHPGDLFPLSEFEGPTSTTASGAQPRFLKGRNLVGEPYLGGMKWAFVTADVAPTDALGRSAGAPQPVTVLLLLAGSDGVPFADFEALKDFYRIQTDGPFGSTSIGTGDIEVGQSRNPAYFVFASCVTQTWKRQGWCSPVGADFGPVMPGVLGHSWQITPTLHASATSVVGICPLPGSPAPLSATAFDGKVAIIIDPYTRLAYIAGANPEQEDSDNLPFSQVLAALTSAIPIVVGLLTLPAGVIGIITSVVSEVVLWYNFSAVLAAQQQGQNAAMDSAIALGVKHSLAPKPVTSLQRAAQTISIPSPVGSQAQAAVGYPSPTSSTAGNNSAAVVGKSRAIAHYASLWNSHTGLWEWRVAGDAEGDSVDDLTAATVNASPLYLNKQQAVTNPMGVPDGRLVNPDGTVLAPSQPPSQPPPPPAPVQPPESAPLNDPAPAPQGAVGPDPSTSNVPGIDLGGLVGLSSAEIGVAVAGVIVFGGLIWYFSRKKG